jgi:Ca2+-binding EF-hand superfamily protein
VLATVGFWCPEDRLTSIAEPYTASAKEFRYRDFLSADAPSRVPTPTDALAQFAFDLEARGVELGDVLASFDAHRCGRVSATNFLRAFGITPRTKSVADQFTHPSTHEIDYFQLGRELKALVNSKAKPATPAVVKTEIPSFFPQFALQLREQQIDYRGALAARDHRCKNRISRRDFIQELVQWRVKITGSQRDEIASCFVDSNGDVDYALFSDEVARVISRAPPAGERKSTFALKPDITKVIAFLKETARNRHFQIDATLREIDFGNTGRIPSGRFARCLTALDFKVSPADIDVLIEEFGDGSGNIEYERFINVIMPQVTSTGPEIEDIIARLGVFLNNRMFSIRPLLEKYKPLTADDFIVVLRKLSFDLTPQEQAVIRAEYRNQSLDAAALCDSIDYVPPAPEIAKPEPIPEVRTAPPGSITEILARLAATERRARIDYLSEFRERDSFKNGQMPVSQFQAIVIGSGTEITNDEIDLLIANYRVSPQRIDYLKLIDDKEKAGVAKPEEGSTVEELLVQFKAALEKRGIPPQDLFVKYDKYQNGTIRAIRVKSVFDSVGIKLTENDDKVLREAFKDEESVDLFDYRKLCASIEPSEDKPIKDRDLLVLLNSLRERIQARRRRIREAFPDGLPNPIGEQAFRNAIGTFGLSIREPEIQRLLKYYGVSRQKDVDWQRFVADVESVRLGN